MTFDLKRLLGQVDKELLRAFLISRGVKLDLDWGKLPAKRYGRQVFEAWQELPPEQQEAVEPDLLEVDRLAQERGVRGMIQTAAACGLALIDELSAYDSMASQILHVMVRHPRFWQEASRFVELDNLVHKPWWTTYPGLPAESIKGAKQKALKLRKEVSGFYLEREGRGRTSDVQHHVRGPKVHYFFVYLDSYVENSLTVVGPNKIDLRPRRPVFDVVFVFNGTSGELSLVAKGGKAITEPLRSMFCRTVFGIEPPSVTSEEPPYRLNLLLDPEAQFPTDLGDGIDQVKVRKLSLRLVGQGRRCIILEGDPDGGPKDVYALAQRVFRDGVFSPHELRVTGVTFRFLFSPNAPYKKRSITFEVSYPRTDTFKTESDAVQDLIRRCLRRWGLDVTEPFDSSNPATGRPRRSRRGR